MGGTGIRMRMSISRDFRMGRAKFTWRWSLGWRWWHRDLVCQWLRVFRIGGVKYLWLKDKENVSQTNTKRFLLNQMLTAIMIIPASRWELSLRNILISFVCQGDYINLTELNFINGTWWRSGVWAKEELITLWFKSGSLSLELRNTAFPAGTSSLSMWLLSSCDVFPSLPFSQEHFGLGTKDRMIFRSLHSSPPGFYLFFPWSI